MPTLSSTGTAGYDTLKPPDHERGRTLRETARKSAQVLSQANAHRLGGRLQMVLRHHCPCVNVSRSTVGQLLADICAR
jgi:hypothetical protein